MNKSKKKIPAPKSPPPVVLAPSVLVCHEKHGKKYFIVIADCDLFRCSLEILRGRFSSDWYPSPSPEPEELDYAEEDIKKMPPSFRALATDKLRRYEDDLRDWKVLSAAWEMVRKALSESNGRLAWSILDSRADIQYERVSLETASVGYEYTEKDGDGDGDGDGEDD